MFYKIKSVIALNGLKLRVVFAVGATKEYDLRPLIEKYDMFRPLETVQGLFDAVQVDAGGYGVSWNDDIDISCNELWQNGTIVKTPFDGMISFGEATSLWGLNESTLRKAVSYGKLSDGIDVQKFGKQWIISKDAMTREYGEPKLRD